MEKKEILHFSGIDCFSEHEETFNEWYDNTHIPMIFRFKGMNRATRYRKIGRGQSYPKYLALYEFDSLDVFRDYQESDELSEAMEEMRNFWLTKGYDRMWRVQYEMLKRWSK